MSSPESKTKFFDLADRYKRTRAGLAVMLSAAALVGAGCGNSDNETAPVHNTAPKPAKTPKPEAGQPSQAQQKPEKESYSPADVISVVKAHFNAGRTGNAKEVCETEYSAENWGDYTPCPDYTGSGKPMPGTEGSEVVEIDEVTGDESSPCVPFPLPNVAPPRDEVQAARESQPTRIVESQNAAGETYCSELLQDGTQGGAWRIDLTNTVAGN